MNASPFDAVAADYDAAFSSTAVGRMQRQIVWDFLENMVDAKPPDVLELNCGTGEDAVWLARRGCRVLATDVSPEMVAVAREKARQAGVDVETRVLGFSAVHDLPEGDFDLILSNFGGLNCVPPGELAALTEIFLKKLRPGGRFVAVVMGRFCWWETLYFLGTGRWRRAFRRMRRGPVVARLGKGVSVDTWYFAPRSAALCVASKGAAQSAALQPVGFWLPPSYLNPFFEKRPRLLRGLYFLEKKCRGRMWAWGADHFLLAVQKPGGL